LARLKLATGSLANVTAFQLALSDRQSTASFMQGTDDLGATSRVLAGRSGKLDGTGAIDIELQLEIGCWPSGSSRRRA
jgi:hypothetical protein